MTTPLFTTAELDTQIIAYKKALLALASAQSYVIDSGSGRRTVTRADLPEIRSTLAFLQREKTITSIGAGPQVLTGRPRR